MFNLFLSRTVQGFTIGTGFAILCQGSYPKVIFNPIAHDLQLNSLYLYFTCWFMFRNLEKLRNFAFVQICLHFLRWFNLTLVQVQPKLFNAQWYHFHMVWLYRGYDKCCLESAILWKSLFLFSLLLGFFSISVLNGGQIFYEIPFNEHEPESGFWFGGQKLFG